MAHFITHPNIVMELIFYTVERLFTLSQCFLLDYTKTYNLGGCVWDNEVYEIGESTYQLCNRW